MTPRASTPLAERLAARIRARGPLTFADYMAACLYDPAHGYYSRPASRRFADYYTSVDVHPIFGRLLARQFHEIWEGLGRPAPFPLVEAGAGTGRLADHILDFVARELPEFGRALAYVAVERSAARRAAHPAGEGFRSAAEMPDEVPVGCIFSNELLDALPVHRVVRAGGDLREIYVTWRDAAFGEEAGPLSTPALADYFREQGVELAEGQQAEAGLAAREWIEDAGRRLGRGFVLTVDYGHEARVLYDARRRCGTLLAYRGHQVSEDFFAAPGEQDLTAHVSFTALELAGRRAGLARTGLVSQAHFLLALGRGNAFADLEVPGQSETDRLRARLLLKNLIHPEGMGETFHVLVQHKGVERPRLSGLEPL